MWKWWARRDSNLKTPDEGHCSDASMLAFIQEKHKWNASRFDNLQPDFTVNPAWGCTGTGIISTNFAIKPAIAVPSGMYLVKWTSRIALA